MSAQDSYLTFSRALRQLLVRPQLQGNLKSSETRDQTMKQLKIDDGMTREILNILMELEGREPEVRYDKRSPLDNHQPIETDKDFLLESFRQLRTAYRTSMAMSVTIFLIGVIFLAIAAIRSFTDPESVIVTAVIGGIGVVQIIAVFYRNPLTDIARTVSRAQQAKIAVMSYLIGISLLNQQTQAGMPTDAHLKSLINLTERALGQLRTYAGSDVTITGSAETLSSDQSVNKADEQ